MATAPVFSPPGSPGVIVPVPVKPAGGLAIDPLSLGLTAVQGLLAGGEPSTAKTALSSVVITGEPISSLALTAGNFFLQNSAKKKAEKSARLAASTQRDKGVTSVMGQFIADVFDPNDAETYSLIDEAEADLSNPSHENRGDRQYQLYRRAVSVLTRQIQEGRPVVLPSGYDLPSIGPSEDAVLIARNMNSGMVLQALDAVARKNGEKPEALYRASTGREAFDNAERPGYIEFLKNMLGYSIQPAAAATPQRESVQGSGGLFSGREVIQNDRIIPQPVEVPGVQPAPVLMLIGVGLIGVLVLKEIIK